MFRHLSDTGGSAVETFITRKWKVAWDGPSRGVTSSSCSAVDQLIPRQQSAVDQLSSARPGGADDGEAERVAGRLPVLPDSLDCPVPARLSSPVPACLDCPVPAVRRLILPTEADRHVSSSSSSSCSCPRKRKEFQEDSSLEHDRKFSRSSSLERVESGCATSQEGQTDISESATTNHTDFPESANKAAAARAPPRKRSSRSRGSRGKREQRSSTPPSSALAAVHTEPAAHGSGGRGGGETTGGENAPPRNASAPWLSAGRATPDAGAPRANFGEAQRGASPAGRYSSPAGRYPSPAGRYPPLEQGREEGAGGDSSDQVGGGSCWVSQQLAHMLRAGREEQEGAGRDCPALFLLADRHKELNRHLFLADSRSSSDGERGWSGGSGSGSGSKVTRSLARELTAVRRRIEDMEQQFVLRTGYRPSQADRQQERGLKALLAEESRLKRAIKAEKENTAAVAAAWPAPPSVGRGGGGGSLREIEEKLREMVVQMEESRSRQGRPYDLLLMSMDQVCQEKMEMQTLLLEYEKVFGHPETPEAKEAMKDIYDRYRMVKRLARRSNSARSRETASDLVTIPEGEALSLTLASPAHRLQVEVPGTYVPVSSSSGGHHHLATSRRDMDLPTFGPASAGPPDTDKNWHALTREELQEIQRRVREEKKTARRAVKEFEESFRRQTGRKALKEDREPLEKTYSAYKVTKSKLKLISALLAKLDRRQFEKYSRYGGRYDR